TLGYQRAAGANGQGMGVVGPVETVGRTLFAGQLGGGGAGDQVDHLLALGEPLDGERHGGGGQLHDRVDLLAGVPLAGDVGGEVRFVRVVGGDYLDRCVPYLAAELLGRRLRRPDRPFAAAIGIGAGLVVEDADLRLAVR